MTRGSRIITGLISTVVLGGLGAEYWYGRTMTHRYQAAMEGRRRLELQYGEMLATHEQLKRELDHERQHARELSEAMASMHTQMDETVTRLSEETHKVQGLQGRLAAVQQQLEQLQGELAMVLQQGATESAKSSNAVQLERIVVSDAGSSTLSGRIVSINQDWPFVIIDLGWDVVRIGDTVSIFRGDQLLAKARIDRVQESICAATILPEWNAAEIRINDLVRIL